jgi:GT2 family glycosyltransferase
MTDATVTAIVVNWRLKEETLRCLRSLERLEPACHVLVVDNGSGDGSAEYIARHSPASDVIELPLNVGFGAACNRALVRALHDPACEYVFFLNNDAVVDPRALSELLCVAQAYPAAGILGPKVYYADGGRTLWYAGARRRWGVLAAADTGRGRVDRGQFNLLREVDYVFGTAMLIRRQVFERVGCFDERFFLYLEDLDLCLRAQAAGFPLLFVPQAHVWHQGSASTAHSPAMRKYHVVKSTVHFLTKHTPLALSPAVLLFWALVSARCMLVDLARGDLAALRSYWLGLINGLHEEVQRTLEVRCT